MKIFFRKGQNLAELALVIGTLGLILIAMQVYVKRGVQGKVKALTDHIISGKQEAYSNDTSALIVNTSNSSLSYSSSMTTGEYKGGKRSNVGTESTTSTYSTESETK